MVSWTDLRLDVAPDSDHTSVPQHVEGEADDTSHRQQSLLYHQPRLLRTHIHTSGIDMHNTNNQVEDKLLHLHIYTVGSEWEKKTKTSTIASHNFQTTCRMHYVCNAQPLAHSQHTSHIENFSKAKIENTPLNKCPHLIIEALHLEDDGLGPSVGGAEE